MGEEEFVAAIGLLGVAHASVLAHGPEAAAVHGGLDAARVGVLAGIAEVAFGVEAGGGQILRCPGCALDLLCRRCWISLRRPAGAGLSAAMFGFDEGTDREPGEDQRGEGGDEEVCVVGAVEGARADLPGVLAEEGGEESEEEAGDFEPEGAADVGERADEGFAEAAGAFTDTTRGIGVIFCGAGCGWRSGRARGGAGLGGGLWCGGCGFGGALLGHARGDTDADAEFASEAIRLHGESVSVASELVYRRGRRVLGSGSISD